jgi:hypothetical protein
VFGGTVFFSVAEHSTAQCNSNLTDSPYLSIPPTLTLRLCLSFHLSLSFSSSLSPFNHRSSHLFPLLSFTLSLIRWITWTLTTSSPAPCSLRSAHTTLHCTALHSSLLTSTLIYLALIFCTLHYYALRCSTLPCSTVLLCSTHNFMGLYFTSLHPHTIDHTLTGNISTLSCTLSTGSTVLYCIMMRYICDC